MTLTVDRPTAVAAPPRRRRLAGLSLVAALAAAAALVLGGPPERKTGTPPARATAAVAWPAARRADIPAGLSDGPLFIPGIFLDAVTAVGTAPSPDGASQRLLVRAGDGGLRQLRKVSLDVNPQFGAFTATADEVVWTESSDRSRRVRIWAARRDGGPARLLTADTGDAVFYGNQFDLVVADGRVHWTAAPGDGKESTEIRSVPLAGGPVQVRTEPGVWALSAWPWLVDDGSSTGRPRLRNLATTRDTEVVTSGPEAATCGPVWCRTLVSSAEGPVRIDVMHPDGSARRRIAGDGVQSAIPDVAVLDRFEILAVPGPDSDVTGLAALIVHDIATGRTVDVAPATDGAFTRGGVLWWSTGDPDHLVWHTIDLRTV